MYDISTFTEMNVSGKITWHSKVLVYSDDDLDCAVTLVTSDPIMLKPHIVLILDHPVLIQYYKVLILCHTELKLPHSINTTSLSSNVVLHSTDTIPCSSDTTQSTGTMPVVNTDGLSDD